MPVIVRFERRADAEDIRAVTEAAFAGERHSDGTEGSIPERLRDAGGLRLSLVAEDGGEVVGHVAFSPATVGGEGNWVALGPVSVRPERQREGIGTRLIEGGLAQVRRGARGCVLLGDPGTYARFGFEPAEALRWGGVSAPYLQVLVWSGPKPSGRVAFHPAFGEPPGEPDGSGSEVSRTLEGRCDCGAVRVVVPGTPDRINACPCDFCRRTGARWSYYPADAVAIQGGTVPYRRAARVIEFHRCGVCGVLTHWADPLGKLENVGVNTAILGPSVLEGVPVVSEP